MDLVGRSICQILYLIDIWVYSPLLFQTPYKMCCLLLKHTSSVWPTVSEHSFTEQWRGIASSLVQSIGRIVSLNCCLVCSLSGRLTAAVSCPTGLAVEMALRNFFGEFNKWKLLPRVRNSCQIHSLLKREGNCHYLGRVLKYTKVRLFWSVGALQQQYFP